jgi:hypothetical protein
VVVLFIADHSRLNSAVGMQFRFIPFDQVK